MNLGKKRFAIGGLWLTSLVLSGYLGWQASSTVPSETFPEAPPSRLSSAAEPAVQHSNSQRIVDLDAEDRALRRKIEDLLAELAKQEGPKKPEREIVAQDKVKRRASFWLDRYLYTQSEGGGGLSGLDELIKLALYVAENGEAGVRYLVDLANEGESPTIQTKALQLLSFFPSPSALRAIMEAPWGQQGLSEKWEWDAVKWQIEELPTADLKPYVEDFRDRLHADFEDGRLGRKQMEMCAQLALRHGHKASRELFEMAWEEKPKNSKIALMDTLTFVETPLSLGFLERVARTDPDPEVRQAAQEAADILSPFVGHGGD